MKASELFKEADRRRISEAITAAEARTTGEIVPVVAGASGRYDRAEDIVGVVTASVLLACAWALFQGVNAEPEGWAGGGALKLGLPWVLLIVIGGFAVGAAAASRFWALRLPFVPKDEMEEEVDRAAGEAFHRFRLRETAESTGILIYISLFEHRVRVLGDSAISAKLGEAEWRAICDAVTDGLKRGQVAGGLVRGIELAGELLTQHFPADHRNPNELVNELILID
jgi:putative membrane protein